MKNGCQISEELWPMGKDVKGNRLELAGVEKIKLTLKPIFYCCLELLVPILSYLFFINFN